MSNRHTVTKRHRRQKSPKRVNHSAETMAALRRLAEAAKAKARADARALALAGGGASDAAASGSGTGHAAVVLQLNLTPGDADRLLPVLGGAVRQPGDDDRPQLTAVDGGYALRADGRGGESDGVRGTSRAGIDPVRAVLPHRDPVVEVERA